MPLTKLNSASVIERLPTGSVLQTVVSKFQSIKSIESSSMVTTGHTLLITPLSASNKILLTLTGGHVWNGNNNNKVRVFTIYRGSTDLGNSNVGLETKYCNAYSAQPHSITVIDSDYNTTNEITYTVYGRGQDSSTGYYAAGSTGSGGDPTPVYLTAMEIKG